MRLIPVIDLLCGLAVHAVKGERKNYQPISSVLCDVPDPLALARAFRDRLGLNEIYIADLDAIRGSRRAAHRGVIVTLTQREKMNIILDAGVSDVGDVRTWLDLGVRKVVVAAETLRQWDAVQDVPSRMDPDRLAFSLDLRAGKILSQCSVLSAMSPMDALKHLQSAGWQEVILLELTRVGSGEGVDRALAAEARANFPDLSLLIGGGIKSPEELVKLESLGVAGALLATALHRGMIDARHFSALDRNPA